VVEYLRVFHHVGFFLLSEAPHGRNQLRMDPMEELNSSMAQRIAEVASAFEEQGDDVPQRPAPVNHGLRQLCPLWFGSLFVYLLRSR
jgi:hypothetical protein